MGLLNDLKQSVQSVVESKTVRISAEELCAMVKKEFIIGADDAYLMQIAVTAKGGVVGNKMLDSSNQVYTLYVGAGKLSPFGVQKYCYVFDKANNVYYQLKYNHHWKRFYKGVMAMIQEEKAMRGA